MTRRGLPPARPSQPEDPLWAKIANPFSALVAVLGVALIVFVCLLLLLLYELQHFSLGF